MADELAGLDATAQAELVRAGQVSALELTGAAIERIERLNPELNAVIHERFEEARAVASGNLPDGPFPGVPFLLKDIGACFAGWPLHMGMGVLKEADFRCPVDTTLAQRFRAAGFVTLGKTNVPELGIQPTTEPTAYGATRNPWDLSRTPGGSSGGAAAAVASGMVPVAHANDGGGSIRIPASCCGLVGLKPTRQRISEGPLIGDLMSGLTAELVVSRSVRDTAASLDAVHGAAPGDPYVAPPPERPYVEELEAEPGPLRVGLMVDPTVPGHSSEPECAAAARSAAALLEALGHSVEEAAPLGAMDGSGLDLEDSFLTRWAAGQASALQQFGRVLGRELVPDDVEPLTWTLAEIGRQRSAGRYLDDVSLQQTVARGVAAWFDSGFDLLLTPTTAELAPPLGTFDDSGGDPFEAFRRATPMGAFTVLANITGQPAISLPLHWTEEDVPIGIQLAAPYGREDLLIGVAAQLERARPWADRRPPLFVSSSVERASS